MKRRAKSKAWMRAHVNDTFVRRAQQDGYRSRAAYKLKEIAVRDRLFTPGMSVIDLGAAPGGWSQIAAAAVGRGGTVVAVDMLEMPPLQGVTVVCGDFRASATLAAIEKGLAGRRVDLVLCDMAPNITGVAASDQARTTELAMDALAFAVGFLKRDGCFLVKLFQGAGFEGFLRTMRAQFTKVTTRKPLASRSHSREIYLVGSGVDPAAQRRDAATDAEKELESKHPVVV